MRLFQAKENVGSVSMTPPRSSSRKFGAPLSTNIAETPPSRLSNIKKIVRVRRTPKSSTRKAKKNTPPASPGRPKEHTVVFTPGPVGLQLEPVAEDPKYGSRVVRFVDGGPKHPGQARKSGIKPGDLVIQAQAENSVATNYEDIIQVLKKSHATRELVFRPVWDASFLETQSSLKLQFQSTSQTPPRNSPSRNAKTPNEVAMSTPVRENTSTAKKLTPFHEESETPLLPRTFGRKEVSSTKRNSNEIRSTLDLNLIHSPSEAVLLSHSFWLDSQPPSEEQERRVEDAHGPTIIPLKSTQESPVSPSFTFIPVTREKPGPLLPGPFSPGTPINHTPNDSIGNSSRSAFTSSSPISNEKVLSESNDSSKTSGNVSLVARNQPSGLTSDVESPTGLCNQRNDPESWSQSLNNLICPETEMNMVLTTPTKTLPQSVRSDASKTTPFSPSKVKELSSTNDEGNWKPKMVSRVFGSLYKTVVPTVASSSYAIGSTVAKKIAPAVASTSYAVGSKVTTKIGEAIVGNSSHDFQEAKKMKLQLLKELSLAKAALDSQDVTKQELEKNMNELFRENVSLRTKFEQEQIRAKVEHAKVERELKELYAQTCLRQENRIRELESCNNRVQRELKEVQSNSIDKAEMLVEEFEKEILTSPTISDADVQAVALTRDREQFLVLQSKLVEIEAELAMKSTELDKVSKTTKAKEEEFHEEIADLLNENSRLQEDSMNNRMELEMSRALVKEFEEDMASTQKELEESQKRNRLLKDEIATLVPQYQNVLSHSGTMIDAKANDFESKLAFLQETCKLQQDATSAAEKQAQESNDLITRLEKEIMGLERNLMESEQRNEILKEEKVKFSSYKEECDSTVQELMRTLQLKENTIAECKTAMTKLQKEKDQFTEEIDLMETQFGKLNYSKMGLEQTLAQTERELADTKGEVSSIHGRLLEQLESGNTYPRIEIEKKDEELQAVIENLGVAQNEVLRLETNLKFLRSFLFAVLVKFKSLEGVNVMAEDRSRHLEKKMEEASSLLRSSREKDMRIESLYSDLSLIEKEKESILSEMKFWKISSEGLEETFRGKTLICANMRSRIDMLTKMKKNIEEGMTRETERNSLSIASLQNNIQALKCDINAKDKELLRFASEIKVVKGDLSRSTKLTKKLEIDLDTKFEELEGTVCRLNECNETATLLKNESELLRNQTSKLESELESKSRELKVSSYTMEAMNSQLLDFQNEIISLSSSKASISSLLRTSDDQAADLQTQMDICQRKLTEESFLLATAQEHVSALEAERKELKIEKSHLIEENQALIKTHAVSESAWKGEVEGLTLKLNSNAQELMDLKQKCTEFESEMVELKSKLIFAKKDGSKTSELLLAAKGEVESLEAEKAGIQKRLKHLQKEKCAVEEKLLGENHFLEAKIKELEIVLSKVELNRRNEITALEKKAQSDENSLQLEITMLRNDYNSMLSCKEETHSSLEKYRTSMTKSLLKANATIASLRAQLKGTQSDHEELRSSFQWTEKERENLVMRTAELQFSHSESLSKNLRLEENISLLENTVVSLDKNNSLLQKSLDGKEEELAANAIQLISRAAIIDELRCELTENHYGIKTIRELCLQTGKTDQKCEQEDGLHTIFSLVKSLIDSEDRCCTELENVEATNKTLKEKIQELENNLLSSQEIVSTLEQLAESRRTDHEDEIALLSKNVNELEGLVDHISKEKQFLKDGFDSTEEELKDLRKSSHHLHVALDNAKQSAEEEKNDFAAVSRKLNDEMSALENKLSFHFAETTRLEEEIEKCTRSRNEEKEDGDKVRSDLNRMEVFVSELQNTVKDAESRLEKANGSIGYGIEREKSFRGQLAESQELLESWLQIYEKELEDSHLDLVASRRNNSTLEEKTRELTREKEALVEETREAEQTISDLRVEILEIHDELDVSSSEDSVDSILRHLNKDELCAELLIAQEELVEAKSRTSEAEAEAANSCDRLKNFQKDLASLTTEMNALVRRNVALENLMKKTESAKHDAETTANDKVIGLERELETNTSEMMMLSQDYEKLQGRMHSMAEYHAQYERENQEQIVKLQKSQSMLQAECVVNFSRGKHQEQEVSNLRHFKADAEEKISDLQAELERNHEERRKLEESAICKEEHNRVEEHELSNLRHFKADAEEKISDLHAELERRHEERKHLEESVICKEDHYRVEEERLKTILSQQREDVAALRTSSESLELKVDAMRSQLERKDEVISSLLEETKNERKRVVDTEASREMAVAKLAEVSGLLIEKQEDLDSLEKRLAESLDELRKLCEKSDCLADEKEQLKRAYSDGLVVISTLTEKAESLALKAISLRENIEQKEEIVGNMTKEKEADREQLKEIEAMRAEAVKKLVEASSDTILKQEEMISLEERLAGSAVEIKELKKTLEVLTEQKAADEQSLSKLKSAQEEKDNLRTKEINRLKTSVVKLEEINGCLKDQLEASTDAVSELKQKPKGAEETEKRSVETVEYLERELSKKQAVIDHLKKTVLLLESTIAKINLSYSNTLSARPSAELDREDAEMVSELSLITTHLASVKAAFHSQKLVLADLKVSEDLLFEFMKEVLSLAKSAEDEVLDWTRKLQENGLLSDPTQLIIALDLAGVKQPRDYVLDIRRRVESLVPIASESIEELETRHQELLRWQQKRLQPPATPLTPTSFAKGSMSSASKMSNRDVVEEMKIVLKDEILSPCKERAKDVKHSDPKRLQEVLESLETKMDGLLQDLEAANDALEEKDRLVNEMERSTERNEAERRSLEGQLFALEEELQASRLIQEFNMRTDCYDRSSDHQLKEATNHNQMAGARLLSNVLEIRCKLEKATAFRKWSCNVGAMKAASNQKHDAVALAQQLQITREKLIVLKAHLNKGRGSHSGEERKKPRLRRLLSRLDKREKLELLPEEEDEKLDL